MWIDIDVDVDGPREQLGAMAGRLENPRALMGILARGLEEYERDVFATQGRGTWAPDDLDTVAQKGSARVLVDEGDLLDELTTARVVGDSVVVDQGRAFYGAFLRDGDRGMPRRNPAPKPTAQHVQRWGQQVLGYVVTGRTR